VHSFLIFIKHMTSMCLQSLQYRFVDWTKPSTPALLLGTVADQARSKSELVAENALLRQQLLILRRHVKRLACTKTDRMLLVLLARMVRTWKQALFIVQPDTLLRWHRQGFQLYWKYMSRAASPKPRISPETVALRKRDGKGQSTMGSGTDPGRIAQAGSSRLHTHDPEVYETCAPCKTTRAELEDLLTHSCRAGLGLRLSPRHGSLLPLAVRLLHHRTALTQSDPRRRHPRSHRRLDCTTSSRSHRLWRGAEVPHP
jgi:hypothetical protein